MNTTLKKQSIDKLKATLIIPFGLIVILIPFSLFIGWNLFTGILFWYIITTALTIYLPELFLRNKSHLLESLIGLAIFYAIMVFMIYKQYKTDYFKIMMISLVVNMLVVIISWSKRHHKPIDIALDKH